MEKKALFDNSSFLLNTDIFEWWLLVALAENYPSISHQTSLREGYFTWSVCLLPRFLPQRATCAQQDIPAASAGHEKSFNKGVFF